LAAVATAAAAATAAALAAVATAAAPVTAAATWPAATTTAAATAAFSTRPGFVNGQRATTHIVAVQASDCFSGLCVVGHFNEPKAS
jgi:hypothetical protein